ncbi:MAG: bifunctional diaminohydroxyphosphoribosylaminopyrimidine deaminase/5-amino-6-(5-phosphoribosylamino)uracil reductase RibD [Candidatus Omnitrophica bacterium]|nr:bifunctional diaminohydroxyphosphoribosylaminopyrimidine deaminase/5-amino-6-(5-phosphoribosylamino)uracil reductase RibD [Candidatus Omnitrophota bacterium]MCM8803187.1 bifunctional diaminohydroxyphosphoribosylaminopyrimidine deaminase/5-amino-6-(5-phosphoribosylamino)uracil reductase RibD [Candidatus Omnitrophota bacterium]
MVEYKKFLKKCFKLAEKGKGLVSPNPLVGAIIAKGERIIGEGYHKAFGLPHAEIEALNKAKNKAKGATLYVNLEPCCHWGKTPPCTEAIIKSGIKEVIACIKDPNPLVNGNGFKMLEENGIKVRHGFFEEEAEEFNRFYITNITKKRPYIILKWAQTIDGKIATYTGSSKWITTEKAREYLKRKRFEFDGILVGINTILVDNPFLDYIADEFQTKKDIIKRKRYYKIILDAKGKTPLESNIWKNEKAKVLIVFDEKIGEEEIEKYKVKPNFDYIKVYYENGKFDLKVLLEKLLIEKNIGIIMVEGGKYTLTEFFENKLFDEIWAFIGNKILGGENSISVFGGENKIDIGKEAMEIEKITIERIENDLLIKGRFFRID